MRSILVIWNSWLRINPLVAKLSSRSFQFLEEKKIEKKIEKKKLKIEIKKMYIYIYFWKKWNNSLISSFWIKRWLSQYVNKLSYEVQKKVGNDCVDSCYI